MSSIDMPSVLNLSVQERLRLLEAILHSITASPEALALTASEREGLNRRLAAYVKDPAAGSAWPKVRARVLSR